VTYPSEVRELVFSLLAQGWSRPRVARVSGVSAMAISRWRAHVGGVKAEPVVDARYLSREERYEFARLHDAGHGVREIARRTGRSAATVSRELRRPQRPSGAAGRPLGPGRRYQPEACHQAAVRARSRPRASRLARDPGLRAWVQTHLDLGLSPEQVSGRLKAEFAEDEQMRISHETIYRAIYVLPGGELRRELRAHLRTGRTGRRSRNTRTPRPPRGISGAVSIHERPEDVEARLVPGHHEGDLVLGPAGTTAAIGTLVERTSGYLTAFLLPHQHTAEATLAGLTEAVNRTGWPMQTLTWDRGTEMARHAEFTATTGIQVYFADPHAPWQRGSNENTNGLLREYVPKGRDIATVTEAELRHAVDRLNNRPRKRHGFLTPAEVLTGILLDQQPQAGVTTIP
jgi:IS30 family transposase